MERTLASDQQAHSKSQASQQEFSFPLPIWQPQIYDPPLNTDKRAVRFYFFERKQESYKSNPIIAVSLQSRVNCLNEKGNLFLCN